MKIISKFHDYYDCIMRHGIDDRVVYVRKTVEDIDVPLQVFSDVDYHFNTGSVRVDCKARTGIVGFCGELYPFIRYEIPGRRLIDGLELKEVIAYCEDDLEKFKKVIDKVRLGMAHSGGNSWGSHDDMLTIMKHWVAGEMKNWSGVRPISSVAGTKRIFEALRVPVFSVEGNRKWNARERRWITTSGVTNPCLKDLKFMKVMDPWTAFQELQMYIGNDLAQQEDPKVPVGNDVEVANSKGYDKWSFRREPGTGRKAHKKRK